MCVRCQKVHRECTYPLTVSAGTTQPSRALYESKEPSTAVPENAGAESDDSQSSSGSDYEYDALMDDDYLKPFPMPTSTDSETSPEAWAPSPKGPMAGDSYEGPPQQASSTIQEGLGEFDVPFEETIVNCAAVTTVAAPHSPGPQFRSIDSDQNFMDTLEPTFSPYVSLFEFDHQPRSSEQQDQLSFLPRQPRSTRHFLVNYYLTYHHKFVNEFHYYSYFDYSRFFTESLFAMAEESDALTLGMAAMSALVYSQRLDPDIKPVSFALYSLALMELQRLINQPYLSPSEAQIATAAAMQLSSFDVPPFHPSPSFPISNLSPFFCLFLYMNTTDNSASQGTIPNVSATWKAPR